MKRGIFILIAIVACVQLKAQEYNVLLIPDSLKKNANVVNRYSEMRLTILSEKKAILYEKEVLTILNEAGARYAGYRTGYDKFVNDINDIDGVLYDASGKKIKEVKKKDISDHSAYDGYSLMSDNRYKEHNFYCNDYPYTIEYEEEDSWNQLFYLPSWDPQISHLMSVQYSKLVVEVPAGFKFRYKQFNLDKEPQITQSKGNTVYTWEVKDLTTKKQEHWQPSWREIMPSVLLAPSAFGVGNYSGNMDSWKSYGDFINVLRKDKDILPEAVKQKVHALTDNVRTPLEKVTVLYNYLQQNSRYVSVQLGVGGWQPFDVNYVITNKYGDCKALSNYMIALLNEAGVKANYVLIDAGNSYRKVYPDFPMTQFNHATVCVPLVKDSVWLECTEQNKPAGYAGTFTGNRKALLINDQGGHIVNTPKYTSKENQIVRTINATINAAGDLTAKISSYYTGCETDDLQSDLEHLNKQEFDRSLKEKFDVPTYDVTGYTHKETKAFIPSIDESFDLTANHYASVTGKRMFLTPNLLTRSPFKIDTTEERIYDVVSSNSFKHVDSISINFPPDYTVESLPKNLIYNTSFGIYSISFEINGNSIYCVRSFVQDPFRLPIADYKKYAVFLNNIYKADRSKIVFVKK